MAGSSMAAGKKQRLKTFRDGRDEMNLVEFPFTTLSERSGNCNILDFQVETYDRVLGRPVVRKLTVTGDAKYGLPTAKDEEVYLGLLQLTKLHNNFSEPKVLFTRSQLIQLMGWKNRDWSYHRVATALARLTGVRLFYENAWRDNAKKKYRTKGGFGLLDSFELKDGRVRSPDGDETERLSEFRWNSVLFDSFQAGYLKKLDYERVRQLGAVARRIYRYLDKHFHPPHRTTLVLNLKTFAFEHIGISRKSDSAQIRRSLTKAITELEVSGFIVPNKKRFQSIPGQRGEWEVVFTLAGFTAQRREKRRVGKTTGRVPQQTPTAVRVSQPDRIDRYLSSLNVEDRQKLEKNALHHASGFLSETLASQSPDGPLADECRRQIVKAFVKQTIGKNTQ